MPLPRGEGMTAAGRSARTNHRWRRRPQPASPANFYFYLWDAEFGPAFIKVCAYFSYPVKVWVNGHEWAKRQCARAGIGFTALSNGFASCTDPAALQAVCDRLGPDDIHAFFDRWMSVLPLPLTDHDRAAG
jgi:hypothetical protein